MHFLLLFAILISFTQPTYFNSNALFCIDAAHVHSVSIGVLGVETTMKSQQDMHRPLYCLWYRLYFI